LQTPHAVKTMNAAEGRVGGYLIVWGNVKERDLQGEYFTPETELRLDWYERRPMLYHHGMDGQLKAAPIGVIDVLRVDDTGVWAEAQLDLRQRYAQVVQRLVERGVLGWSSGSLPHLVEVAKDGRIVRWPIIEGSLTPTPAEPRRTDVQTIKSAYEALGLDVGRIDPSPPDPLSLKRPEGEADFPQRDTRKTVVSFKSDQYHNMKGKQDTMQDETITTEIRSPRKRLPVGGAEGTKSTISVGSAFDRLEALDLLHGYMLLRSAKSFQGVSEQYSNALSHKIRKAGMTAVKADELMNTAQTGFGDEWVPELWSAQIWEKARLDNVILPLFRSIEMPSSPFELPIEGTDPSVYFVPETANETQLTLSGSANPIPDSKMGSGKVQLVAKKLALRVGFSAELVEDAILPVLNIYREQAVRAIADSIDYVLLNGDTEEGVEANINVPTAPVGNERFMAFDGLRKLPLVTNTGNMVAMAAEPTLAKLRQTRFAMSSRYAARPGDLAWIVDSGTYAKLLALPEFLTMDKAGVMATAITGQIGLIDGIPVLLSAEMPLTSVSGYVSSTGNTKGTALCVYRPGWFVGYRRRIAVNVDYLPYYDSYQLTATVRLAFANFDNEVASALVNITV
jgi:HK97 family phage major capsid protein